MVSQFPRRGHDRGQVGGQRRILWRIAWGLSVSMALLLAALLWLLPELGRRGDFNRLVEDTIRSTLSIPVQIGRVETDALSEFSITRVQSVAAEAAGRFLFLCDRLTVFYRPLELVFGRRLRELTALRPSLFLDLDRDLSGIVHLPPSPSGEAGGFTLDRFRISGGRLQVRIGGHDLWLEELELDSAGIGGAGDVSFEARARAQGARILVRGELERFFGPPGAPARYRIQAASVELDELDLEPVLAALAPAGLRGGGLLSLSGSAEGVWPEKVEVRLSSRLKGASAAPAETAGLLAGEGDLQINAAIHGELDRVEFSISLGAQAELRGPPASGTRKPPSSRQEAALLVRGEFEKRGPEGGGARVRIEESRLEVKGLGALEAGGQVSLAGEEPALDLDLRLPSLPLDRLSRHPLGEPLAGIAGYLEGELELKVHAGGTAASPVLGLEFQLQRGGLRLGKGKTIPAAITGQADRISFLDRGRKIELSGVRVSARALELSDLAAALGPPPAGLDLRGKLDLEARSAELVLPPDRLSARVDFAAAGGSLVLPSVSLEAPAFEARGSLALEGRSSTEVRLGIQASLSAGEVALGPVVESLADPPLSLSGEVVVPEVEGGTGARLALRLEAPSVGPVDVSGTVVPAGEGGPALDLKLEAPSIQSSRFLETYLRDPFRLKLPVLEGGTFSGRSSLSARLRGRPEDLSLEGRVRASDLRAALKGATIDLEALEVPFRMGREEAGGGPSGGLVRIRRLQSPAAELSGVEVRFDLAGGVYRIPAGGVRFPLLGGTLELGEVELKPAAAAGERLRMALTAKDLNLEEVTPLLGFPVIPGRMLLDVRALTFAGERLLLDGILILDVFGGRVELKGLSVDHVQSPYRIYSLALGTVRDLDLAALGKAFRFGLASGILRGWVRNLVTTASQVVGFEAEFETVRRPGVRQFLDQTAIESIRKTVSGPFGALRRMFFSKFRYAGFGFRASLERGRFRLRGKYHFGGTEYIMYSRWYQFPRVEIVNTQPDIDYDWASIFENLKDIYRGSAAKNGGER